jgi:AP-1 complex subunit mu
MAVFSFIYRLIQVFVDYFTELEEESIRDNFVIIYELLDEVMDFGYPQHTESKVLKEYEDLNLFEIKSFD